MGKLTQKRKVHTLKGKSTQTDYKRVQIDYKSQLCTTKFIDRPQKTTKVGHRLQSLLIDYKRLQKLDIDYKAY